MSCWLQAFVVCALLLGGCKDKAAAPDGNTSIHFAAPVSYACEDKLSFGVECLGNGGGGAGFDGPVGPMDTIDLEPCSALSGSGQAGDTFDSSLDLPSGPCQVTVTLATGEARCEGTEAFEVRAGQTVNVVVDLACAPVAGP